MPQHWVARPASIVVAVALAIIHALAPGGTVGVSDASAAYAFSSAPRFALPWAEGTTWRLTGGPHNHYGRSRPWSSLDFAGPLAGGAYRVTAAAGGTIVRPCPNLVEVRHADGWRTSYYHLKDIRVRAGQKVKRGQLLGFTSTRSGCGGSASGSHVHFTVKHGRDLVNIRGMRIGGWTVREGDAQYYGCLVRPDVKRCAPGGRVLNFGV